MSDDNHRFTPGAHALGVPPDVSAAFHWTHESWGHALRSKRLDALTQHLFTSAQLRLPAHATAAERARAWGAIGASLGIRGNRLFRVRQVHGRGVRVIRADDPASQDPLALPEGDAIASNVAGVALAVVVADCVPVLLVDPRVGAAAAVHAGWRGTCAGVATAAVRAMRDGWGTRPEDIVAALGPSIGPADYQVGESLIDAFRQAGHGNSITRWFSRTGDVLRLDLWRANVEQLEAAGVPPGAVVTAGVSTASHLGWFESYRRDGVRAGRLVAAVVVPRPVG